MKISINAPSYKRPDGVDTLKYIPDCKIWVCETEVKEYRKHNKGHKIVSCKKGIQGNLCRIRNHILDIEFKKGMDAIVMIDDDLQYLGYHDKKKKYQLEPDQVKTWIIKYTFLAKELGVKIWGVNCNQDKQSYREFTPFSMVSYIGGPFSVHLPNPLRYDERLPLKEDYDLTLQHLNKYRKILRLNKFFYISKQGASGSGQTGGCATVRNLKREIEQLRLLQKKWGSRIVKKDFNERSHSSQKNKKFDLNPVIRCPIRGV